MTKPSQQRCADVRIAGMTCASCELLLERKLRKVHGVADVDINHRTGRARITADAATLPSLEEIAKVVKQAGYRLVSGDEPSHSPSLRTWVEIAAVFVIVIAAWKLFAALDLVSFAPAVSDSLSFGGALLIGLVAGTSSCLAVTGGLLLTMAAKYNELHRTQTAFQKFRPLLQFNIGRLVSYFVLGGLTGVVGQWLILGTKLTGVLNIAVALVMLALGLGMLGAVPRGFAIRPPKAFSRRITALAEAEHPLAPFLLGAGTFFLPCGFTQSLQFMALASGNFLTGSVTMFAFALGTLPSLLGISALSSTAKGRTSHWFLRFSGAIVSLLALFNIQSGIALLGFDVSHTLAAIARGNIQAIQPIPQAGAQDIFMAVTPTSYEPSTFTIKVGVPVHWTIEGSQARGCTSMLVIPDLGIRKPLTAGTNVIDFTPQTPGQLAFSCSMGMVTGSFTVL